MKDVLKERLFAFFIEIESVGERAFWTAVEVFAGSLTATSLFEVSGRGDVDISILWLATAAGVGAAISVIKEYAKTKARKEE